MGVRRQVVLTLALLAIASGEGSAQIQVGSGSHPEFELEFEPMLDDIMVLGSAMEEALAQQGAAARKQSLDSHEDKLDRELEAHFGAMLSSIGKPAPQKLRNGRPLPVAISSALGGQHMGALPIEAFRSLFPGPLIIEESPLDELGLGGPDPIVMEMLGETHSGFQEEMLPMVHAAQAARNSPKACHKDIMKHCGQSGSQLHCLGAHQEDISKECHDTVGKSVPFVCSGAVDKYCDTLHGGILPCLEQHLADLEQNCQDAIVATRVVITTANTHKVSLSNEQSGAKASVQPTTQAAIQEVHKEMQRQAAQAQRSQWRMTFEWLFILTLCAFALIVYKGPEIYLPECFNSGKGFGGPLAKLQVASDVLRGALAALTGWGRGREAEHLLSGTELHKPVESLKF